MIRVKVCGITNIEDAMMAYELGAHAIGFVFARSPRQVRPDKVKAIVQDLPPFVQTVGVFVNESPARVKDIMVFCGLDLVQFHGDEPPELCQQFLPRSLKAIGVERQETLRCVPSYRGSVRALVLDTHVSGKRGGTGKAFDWDLAVKAKEAGIPIVLAGGIGPNNIKEAVAKVRPYAVDVNSRVEERPGKKSEELLKKVFGEIRSYGSV